MWPVANRWWLFIPQHVCQVANSGKILVQDEATFDNHGYGKVHDCSCRHIPSRIDRGVCRVETTNEHSVVLSWRNACAPKDTEHGTTMLCFTMTTTLWFVIVAVSFPRGRYTRCIELTTCFVPTHLFLKPAVSTQWSCAGEGMTQVPQKGIEHDYSSFSRWWLYIRDSTTFVPGE